MTALTASTTTVSRKTDEPIRHRYERFTEDPRSSRIPACLQHLGLVVDLFERLRQYRRAAEDLVLAEAEFTAGKLPESELNLVVARYEAARGNLLGADKTVRLSSLFPEKI